MSTASFFVLDRGVSWDLWRCVYRLSVWSNRCNYRAASRCGGCSLQSGDVNESFAGLIFRYQWHSKTADLTCGKLKLALPLLVISAI